MSIRRTRTTLRAASVWVRGALRRPGRALVVVATLGVMTVGVVAALVAGDSLEQLFIADARAQWPGVDVAVASADNAVFEEGLARTAAVEAGTTTSAWAPRLSLPAIIEHKGRRDASAAALGLGPEEQSYPSLRALEGSADPLSLQPDEAIVNSRTARRLALGLGDELQLRVALPEIYEDVPANPTDRRRDPETVAATVTVAGIVADDGVADLQRTSNVLLRRDALQRITRLEGQVTQLHLTAALAGEQGADDVVRRMQPFLRQTGLVSSTPLSDALEIADDEGGQFKSILMTLALLVVAAAVVAAIQLLTALAQDRYREVAVLRALGVPSSVVARLVTVEALMYAIVAAAIGTVLALPLANLVARALADHFAALNAGRGREQVALEPFVDPATLIWGVIIVLVAAALAGRAAGRRMATIEPEVLLRGPLVEMPGRPLSMRRPVVVALLGALLLGTGLSGGEASDALRYLGLTLLGAAWWLRLRRVRHDRVRVDTIAAIIALVWATAGAGLLADFSQGYETGFGTLVVAGAVSVIAVTVLITSRFRGVTRLLRSYAPRGRAQAALRTAGAYAETASGRTGRLHATFGIVLFMAAALQVLGSATAIDTTRQSGGFDVIAHAAARLDLREVTNARGVEVTAALQSTVVPEDRYGVEHRDDDDAEVLRVRYPVRLAGITGDFAAAQAFGLAEALPEYDSAAAALDAVIRDRDKAVVDRYTRPPGAELGDDVVLDLGAGPRTYELIAVLDTFLLRSVLIAENEFLDIASSPGPTFLLVRGGEDVAPGELATSIEAAGGGAGVDAMTVTEVADDVTSANRTFTDTFALILLLGLVVALVAVAAMLARSARERRPYLAVLRAIGFRRRTVAATVAAEPVAVAGVGALAGLAVGLVVLRALFAAGFSDLAFVVDVWRSLAVLAGVIVLLVVVCAATAWPAVPRDPSEALRDIA